MVVIRTPILEEYMTKVLQPIQQLITQILDLTASLIKDKFTKVESILFSEILDDVSSQAINKELNQAQDLLHEFMKLAPLDTAPQILSGKLDQLIKKAAARAGNFNEFIALYVNEYLETHSDAVAFELADRFVLDVNYRKIFPLNKERQDFVLLLLHDSKLPYGKQLLLQVFDELNGTPMNSQSVEEIQKYLKEQFKESLELSNLVKLRSDRVKGLARLVVKETQESLPAVNYVQPHLIYPSNIVNTQSQKSTENNAPREEELCILS